MQAEQISVAEAARRLGLGLGYVYGLIWSGRLEARKEGGRWLVDAQAVESRRMRAE
jgi:excisionase family DNA binding protein